MRRLSWLAAASLAAACGTQVPAPVGNAAEFSPKPHATLAQVMRGIPFPSSNIIFDTQTTDPGASAKPGDARLGATAAFSSVYGGWQAVENSALALAESANLMMIKGRLCENGRPAPVEREDYRRAAEGLAEVGRKVYDAARSKNLEAMVDISGTVADACAACHEVYRDKDDRCIP